MTVNGSGNLPVYDSIDDGIRLIEEERRRIARDLHDGPAQTLTNISMRLDILRQLFQVNPQKAMDELERTNSRLVGAINDIRQLIYDLRPLAIDEIGLHSAIVELCNKYDSERGLSIQLDMADATGNQLSPAKQVAIYRLIQEILNNIHKHAEATMVQIQIVQTTTELTALISDNGKGFDPSIIPSGHYGIIGMKERAGYLGGLLNISSTIGHGSEFRLVIPIQANDSRREKCL